MKFFLDTADVAQIKLYASMGFVDGVTTNPTLIRKSGRKQREVVEEICKIVKGPVSVEGIGNSAEEIVKDGIEYASWAKNVVVKVPMTLEGMRAVKMLSAKGIKTNVTLVFSPVQALLAAKAGATYVSPFVGRLDDVSEDGMALIGQIVHIYKNYNFATEVLVASVRHPMHVVIAALTGAHVCTVPPEVFGKLASHPLTDIGIEKFAEDWAASLKGK